jgi:hypothetical protein
MRSFALALAAAALAAMPAMADDSSAALGAGGLVFVKQADIRMAAEDLRISPKEVKVRYEFVNDGKSDVATVVAFPMPDIDVREFWYEPLGTTLDHTANFMGFALTVDGKAVTPTLDERAVLDGRDVTALVKAAGLPINIAGSDLVARIDKLAPAQKKTLAAEGLVEVDGNDTHPHWVAKTSYWWHQSFAAGKTVVIEHRYQPVTGQSFFGELSLATKEQFDDYNRNFCIDDATKAAIRARIARLDKNGPNGSYLQSYRTEFVLKTAANWKGPIGRFHLTVDKLAPANVLSMCWGDDLKKTGPTTFESTRENFAPARDVKVLVLQ